MATRDFSRLGARVEREPRETRDFSALAPSSSSSSGAAGGGGRVGLPDRTYPSMHYSRPTPATSAGGRPDLPERDLSAFLSERPKTFYRSFGEPVPEPTPETERDYVDDGDHEFKEEDAGKVIRAREIDGFNLSLTDIIPMKIDSASKVLTQDTTEFATLLRDIALLSNMKAVNVNDMLSHHSGKKVKMGKAAAEIIRKNNEKHARENMKLDQERLLDIFSRDVIISWSFIYEKVDYFITDEARDRFLFRCLKLAKEQGKEQIYLRLYLTLLPREFSSEKDIEKEEKKTMKKVKVPKNFASYQFEELHNMLPPLDFGLVRYERKLDEWQLEVLTHFNNGHSVIVSAPTSCGKTWLALYPGIKGEMTVFYVVPTKALVLQVAAYLNVMDVFCNVVAEDLHYIDKRNKVTIGTPFELETYLMSLSPDEMPEVCVFDEVHNIDNTTQDGAAYERLIVQFRNSQCLALSATIGNVDEMVEWFSRLRGKRCKKVVYTTRFLNLHRNLWTDNHLDELPALSCVSMADMTEEFLSKNLPMTPDECVRIYKALTVKFGESETETIKPETVFPEGEDGRQRRLTLEDAHHYEQVLKSFLVGLSRRNPEKMEEFLNSFRRTEPAESEEVNITNLFRAVKVKNLMPCIAFQSNSQYCQEIFINLIKDLDECEQREYPFRRSTLRFIEHFIKEATAELQSKLETNSKTGAESVRGATKDQMKGYTPSQYVSYFKESFMSRRLKELKVIMAERYADQVKEVEENPSISPELKAVIVRNLQKELENFQENGTMSKPDVFSFVEEFCFNPKPIHTKQIREAHHMIRNTLGYDMEYTHPFIDGLRRGIGLYTSDLPDAFKYVVQRLAQTGYLGIVISDESLAVGINMPFRSSCILGYKDSTNFSRLIYEQMIGRSGRRGQDREGHIIYANVDWRNLMRGEISSIRGQSHEAIMKNYSVIDHLNPTLRGSEIFSMTLRPVAAGPVVCSETKPIRQKIQWILRKALVNEGQMEQFMELLDTFDVSRVSNVDFITMVSLIVFDNKTIADFIDFQSLEHREISEKFSDTWSLKLYDTFTRNHLDELDKDDIKKVFSLLCLIRDVFNTMLTDMRIILKKRVSDYSKFTREMLALADEENKKQAELILLFSNLFQDLRKKLRKGNSFFY